MNTPENPREVLTMSVPITFNQAIIELCDLYDCADTPDLRFKFREMQPSEIVQWTMVLAEDPDGKHGDVLYLEKAVSDLNDGEKNLGYFIYRRLYQGEIYPDIEGGYKQNLTAEEEKELAIIFATADIGLSMDNDNRKYQLMWKKTFPLTPAERTERIDAANDPSKIREYLTLNQAIPLGQAMAELGNLYSFFGKIPDGFKSWNNSFDADSKGEFTLVVEGNDMPNIVHLKRFNPKTEISDGLTLYPEYMGAEDFGDEYRFVAILPGPIGGLNQEEELELAKIVYESRDEQPPRFDELSAIKKGTLTREEAREMRDLEAVQKPRRPALWPDRLQFLFDKFLRGDGADFTVQQWIKIKKAQEGLIKRSIEEGEQHDIQRCAQITASLSNRLKALFGDLVPTDETLECIERIEREKYGPWKLVFAGKGRRRSSPPPDFLKPYIRDSSNLLCEAGRAYVQGEEAAMWRSNILEIDIIMFFARRDALESITAIVPKV